jgi:hypothetical protein
LTHPKLNNLDHSSLAVTRGSPFQTLIKGAFGST